MLLASYKSRYFRHLEATKECSNQVKRSVNTFDCSSLVLSPRNWGYLHGQADTRKTAKFLHPSSGVIFDSAPGSMPFLATWRESAAFVDHTRFVKPSSPIRNQLKSFIMCSFSFSDRWKRCLTIFESQRDWYDVSTCQSQEWQAELGERV